MNMANSTNSSNLDYTKLTHSQIVNDFIQRVKNDSRFAKLSNASIFVLLTEAVAGVFDMSNYYIQRTAEENFIDTARLTSSIIKWCHNLSYQPRRPIPAHANIAVQLKGPLPITCSIGDVIWFNTNDINFTYSDHNYIFQNSYSYTLTASDISNGKSSTWSKLIKYAIPSKIKDGYIDLNGAKAYKTGDLEDVKVIQGTRKTTTIKAKDYVHKMRKQYQKYDINDLNFSDYIGERDPFAIKNDVIYPANGICRIGLSKDVNNPYERTFNIELTDIYLNSSALAYNDSNTTPENPLDICKVYSNQDKTVRIEFGDGAIASNGFNNIEEILTISYLSTDGYVANKSGSTGDLIKTSNKFYSIGTNITNVTNNISFILQSDIAGGSDFESDEKMKRNAKIAFSSQNSLISLQDYQSFLMTLSDPINVQHASVVSEYKTESSITGEHHELQNVLLYSITNSFYRNSQPLNIFDDQYDTTAYSNLMLYDNRTEYLDHILDTYRLYKAPYQFYLTQYGDNTSSFRSKLQDIQGRIKYKTETSSRLYSIIPIVHYFDIVGNIKVNKTADIGTIKNNLETEITEYFDKNVTFNTEVYKADLSSKILNIDNVATATIDIKPSNLLKSPDVTYNFIYGTNFELKLVNSTLENNYNILLLDINTSNGSIISADLLANKRLSITIYYTNSAGVLASYNLNIIPKSVTEYNGIVTIVTPNNFEIDGTISSENEMELLVAEEDDLASLSALSRDSVYSTGTNTILGSDVLKALTNYLSSLDTKVTSDRAIPLPYYLYAYPKYGHAEEYKKLSNSDYNVAKFLYEGLDNIIKSLNITLESTNLTSSNWIIVNMMVKDLYMILAASLADSVLDENNNVVNYSLPNEIPVFRLNQLTYSY